MSFCKKSAFLMVRKPIDFKSNPYFKEKFVDCGNFQYFLKQIHKKGGKVYEQVENCNPQR